MGEVIPFPAGRRPKKTVDPKPVLGGPPPYHFEIVTLNENTKVWLTDWPGKPS